MNLIAVSLSFFLAVGLFLYRNSEEFASASNPEDGRLMFKQQDLFFINERQSSRTFFLHVKIFSGVAALQVEGSNHLRTASSTQTSNSNGWAGISIFGDQCEGDALIVVAYATGTVIQFIMGTLPQ